jgi:AraC family transcriptional activator of mtrCDE
MPLRLSFVAWRIIHYRESVPMALHASPDTLSGLAPLLRVRPELQYLCRFGAQWASTHPPEPDAWVPFHIVTKGTCMLRLAGSDRSTRLETGDVAVLPHGSPHVVHGPGTPPEATGPFGIRSWSIDAILVKSNTDEKPEAQLICGRLKFDHAGRNLLLSALPEVIVVAAEEGPDALRMRGLVALVKEELDFARPGSAAIAVDLASALLVMAVRAHLESGMASGSILPLLGHPQAGRAVAAMLEQPDKAWSLDELADLASASRASLVRIFRKTAQMSPLAFLADLRLELARRKLSDSARPIAAIAAEVGYQSESAFSRAFRLRYGMRPGEARDRRTRPS